MIISGLQAKAKDRQWLKNQTSGELDDTKLIEGKLSIVRVYFSTNVELAFDYKTAVIIPEIANNFNTYNILGITGEKAIYKKRGEQEPEPGAPQEKPKRLRLLVDLSGSMYRFNGIIGIHSIQLYS